MDAQCSRDPFDPNARIVALAQLLARGLKRWSEARRHAADSSAPGISATAAEQPLEVPPETVLSVTTPVNGDRRVRDHVET